MFAHTNFAPGTTLPVVVPSHEPKVRGKLVVSGISKPIALSGASAVAPNTSPRCHGEMWSPLAPGS